MASFTVVSMVKEDPEFLKVFCRFFTDLGAARIVLYYDGSAEEAASLEVLAKLGPVTTIACDDAFWTTEGVSRPQVVSHRQTHLFTKAFMEADTDWLLACDADELLITETPFQAWLDTVPAEVEAVKFPTAEAVWGPGEDIEAAFSNRHFRLMFPDARTWRRAGLWVYGLTGLVMKQGLVGHELGKCVTRVGARDLLVRNHRVMRNHRDIATPVARTGLPMVHLAHFDAINFTRWHYKSRRAAKMRTTGSSVKGRRRLQRVLAYRLSRLGTGPMRWFFRRLYCLSGGQMAALRTRGLLIERDLLKDQS